MTSNAADELISFYPDSRFDFDIVGVGALNLDYIAPASTLSPHAISPDLPLASRLNSVLKLHDGPIELGAERSVQADAIYAALEAVDTESLKVNLGGSAFNAITAIARTELGLRLGYVGVAGQMPMPGISNLRQLEMLGIDCTAIRRDDDALCGICFSFLEDGERTLLTHGGANESMADYLESEFESVVDYLARARVVHLTSFLDPRTPAVMASVIEALKKRNPDTLISFDPGHVWATEPTPDVEALLGFADYLLVNNREFAALGAVADGSDELAVAESILRRAQPGATVVVKRATGITTFSFDVDDVVKATYPQAPLPDHVIQDATGAGDVFAAGLLAMVTADRLQIELGALLGMELARHKLRYVGHSGHSQFPAVARNLIRSLDAGRRAPAEPSGVFISHGGRADWLAVKELVEDELGLPVHYFERQSWGSHAVTEAIEANLAMCSFALCVLTVEDLTAEGKRLARQNVIHEIGLFQGRYGFDRVIVLVEEGCDYVPQLARPYTIEFPHNGIRAAFWQLRRMIKGRTSDRVKETAL